MSKTDPAEDIERIRRIRDEASEPEVETQVEMYVCPVEGCSRTVIGSPDALRSHVRQSGEESHRHRTLNEALEIEFEEEAYHADWGPGLSQDGDERQESIYTDYEGAWGPGAPTVGP